MSRFFTGALLINKKPGVSSFRALSPVKRVFHGHKIGHTGTLDPFATGLLVILVGPLTRLAPELTGFDKVYEAILRFGAETDTLDPTGTVVHTSSSIPELSRIHAVLPQFTGTIQQVPPRYSAVHVNGRRAYDLARSGVDVQMTEREVSVHSIDILNWEPPDLTIRVACGSGTYIRSLARDIGIAADSRASLHELHRTEVGPFHVEDSIDADVDAGTVRDSLLCAYDVLGRMTHIACCEALPDAVSAISNGKPFHTAMLVDASAADGCTQLAVFDHRRQLCAMVNRTDEAYRYRFVMPQ